MISISHCQNRSSPGQHLEANSINLLPSINYHHLTTTTTTTTTRSLVIIRQAVLKKSITWTSSSPPSSPQQQPTPPPPLLPWPTPSARSNSRSRTQRLPPPPPTSARRLKSHQLSVSWQQWVFLVRHSVVQSWSSFYFSVSISLSLLYSLHLPTSALLTHHRLRQCW